MTLTKQNVEDLIYATDHGVNISKTQKATISATLNAEMCENELNTDSDLSTDATLYDFDNVSEVEPSAVYDIDYEDRAKDILFAQYQLSESSMLKYIHQLVNIIRNK